MDDTTLSNKWTEYIDSIQYSLIILKILYMDAVENAAPITLLQPVDMSSTRQTININLDIIYGQPIWNTSYTPDSRIWKGVQLVLY